MKTIRNRIKSLNATKQSIIKRFSTPPGDNVGKEGDIGIAVVPKKGLHLFYKLGGRWYGTRLERIINKKSDDDRVVIKSGASKESGELINSGDSIKVRISDGTDKELYRAGGTNIAIADGGTNADTADAALSNLGGTATGINVFKAADAAGARSAIGAGTGSGTVTASSTDTFTNKSIDADGTGNNITNIEDANIKSGAAIATSKLNISANVKTLLDNANTADFISDLGLDAGDISDFDTEVANNTAVAANTGKTSFPGFGTSGGTALEGDTTASDIGGITASSTHTLTNKTFDANGTGNSLSNVDLANDVTGNLPDGNIASAGTWNGKINASVLDANTVLYATSDDTPAALSVAASTIVGRRASGDMGALGAGHVRTIINVEDGADVTDAANVADAGAAMLSGATFTGAVKSNVYIGFGHPAEETIGTTGDLTIDFQEGNKRRMRFTANSVTVNNLNLVFPNAVSGNFMFIIKNGTDLDDGSPASGCAITSWKVYKTSVGGGNAGEETDVVWHGGSTKKPTISTTGNRVDIISFYWDSDEEICYGQAGIGFY
jgi:hypothetical protein